MKKIQQHALTFHDLFDDNKSGFIKIDSVCYVATPVQSRKEVYLGCLVIFNKLGNCIKDVGYVDGIDIQHSKEHYTINSIPSSYGGAKSKLHSFCVKNLDYADISHVLTPWKTTK